MKVIYSFEYIFILLESLPAEETEREKKTVSSERSRRNGDRDKNGEREKKREEAKEVEETEIETKTERERKNGKKRKK